MSWILQVLATNFTASYIYPPISLCLWTVSLIPQSFLYLTDDDRMMTRLGVDKVKPKLWFRFRYSF